MKIVYLTWGETPRLSGVYSSQVLRIVKKIQENNEIHLICGLPLINSGLFREKFSFFKSLKFIKNYLKKNEVTLFHIIPIFAIQTVIYPKKCFDLMLTFFADRLLLKKLNLIKPNIVHCRGYHSTYIAIALRKKYQLNYKIIFDPRGFAPGEAVVSNNCKYDSYTYNRLLFIENYNVQHSDLILTVSDPMKDYFLGIGAKNVLNVFLSSSFNLIKTNKERSNPTKIIFAYAGALDAKTWHKPQNLIDLFSRLKLLFPTSELKIITNSNHLLIKKIIPKDLLKDISFISCSNSDSVLFQLTQCSVGLLTYYTPKTDIEMHVAKSVFAIKTVEYLAAGLPIIVNEFCGGASSFIVNNSLGWAYDPNKVKEFVLDEDEIQNATSRINSDILKNYFSYEANIMHYEEIYKKLLIC